jgi:protein-S-isoprenylcysteine O-methyltransferase Ste14
MGFFLTALAVLIFLPAWSLAFWQGWVYLAIFSTACLGITLYFLRCDPQLIESRLSAGASAEIEPAQKTIQGLLGIVFFALFVLSGLDHAFGWSIVPVPLVVVADIAVIAGFWIVFRTFQENGHASSIIEVRPDQPVVTTGP